MKVVLFCGGLGLACASTRRPFRNRWWRSGPRPILWHIMRYYAHFGKKDFVLCLGYKGDVIKNFFLHYDEAVSNDFVAPRVSEEPDPAAQRHP